MATCKPTIRRIGSVGDWVIGTGSKQKDRGKHLVYVMNITEAMTFNEYWEDERFQKKKPNLRGSKKQAFGDNIYFQDDAGQWHQRNSHHSYPDGSPNPYNTCHDTKADKVLLSIDYAYWGGSGPEIPLKIRNYAGYDIRAKRGHKCRFPEVLVKDFIAWFRSLEANGYLDAPIDWPRTP